MSAARIKVLVADDDEDQLAVRKMLLDHSGFEAITASNGVSALQAAQAEHPACAIVDLRLPSEDEGLTLIRELKAFESKMHIFVLTGGNPARLNRLPERKMIDEVIEKGSPAAKLIRKLREISIRPERASDPKVR